jgi:hypothetical protein
MNRRAALVVLAVLLTAVAGCGLQAEPASPAKGHPGTSARPAAARPQLLIRLRDHGSTNTPGWILTVNTDGSGALTHDERGNAGRNRSFPAGTFAIGSLRAALRRLASAGLPSCPEAKAIAPVEVNLGSVSFGSYATLFYRGKTVRSFCLSSPAEMQVSRLLASIVARARPF